MYPKNKVLIKLEHLFDMFGPTLSTSSSCVEDIKVAFHRTDGRRESTDNYSVFARTGGCVLHQNMLAGLFHLALCRSYCNKDMGNSQIQVGCKDSM